MLVVDVETTGVSAWKNSLVSVGAVDFENPSRQFYEECGAWEGAEIDPVALEINGFSKEKLLHGGKQSIREMLLKFIEWVKKSEDKTIAGHNPAFDFDFLNVAAKKNGLSLPLGRRTVDLHSVCFTHIKGRGLTPPLYEGKSSLNSDAVHRYVGLPEEPRPHIAITGAKMEAEALSRLIKGEGLLSEFANYKLPSYLRKIN